MTGSYSVPCYSLREQRYDSEMIKSVFLDTLLDTWDFLVSMAHNIERTAFIFRSRLRGCLLTDVKSIRGHISRSRSAGKKLSNGALNCFPMS